MDLFALLQRLSPGDPAFSMTNQIPPIKITAVDLPLMGSSAHNVSATA